MQRALLQFVGRVRRQISFVYFSSQSSGNATQCHRNANNNFCLFFRLRQNTLTRKLFLMNSSESEMMRCVNFQKFFFFSFTFWLFLTSQSRRIDGISRMLLTAMTATSTKAPKWHFKWRHFYSLLTLHNSSVAAEAQLSFFDDFFSFLDCFFFF